MKLSDFDDDYIERLKERFWAKVDKRGPDDCWEWTGAKNSRGYGLISLRIDGRDIPHLVHRVIVMLDSGLVDDDLYSCHKCDNPVCVNPRHLFMGTATENMRDMFEKGRNRHLRGEKSPNSKLLRREVIAIKELIGAGKSLDEIAGRFGVTTGAIWHIRSGNTWSHIE